MGQLLHGSARTTEAVRRTIQRGEESARALARRHGVSRTTVQKWRKRTHANGARMGRRPFSTVLTAEEKAMIVAFWRHTLLAAKRLSVRAAGIDPAPPLSASPLSATTRDQSPAGHDRRQGSLSAVERPAKQKFKAYAIGDFHMDIAEVRMEEASPTSRQG